MELFCFYYCCDFFFFLYVNFTFCVVDQEPVYPNVNYMDFKSYGYLAACLGFAIVFWAFFLLLQKLKFCEQEERDFERLENGIGYKDEGDQGKELVKNEYHLIEN